jgi:hypothetical protein
VSILLHAKCSRAISVEALNNGSVKIAVQRNQIVARRAASIIALETINNGLLSAQGNSEDGPTLAILNGVMSRKMM